MKTTKAFFIITSLLILTSCNGKKGQTLESITPTPASPSTPDTNTDTGGGTDSGSSGSGGDTGSHPAPPPSDTNPAGKISINHDLPWTSGSSVALTLSREEAKQMKISENASCDGGTWEPYNEAKIWPLSRFNQEVSISVQFIDFENRKTACATAKIGHDSTPPAVTLRLDPQNTFFAEQPTRIFYAIQEAGVGIKEVICSINKAIVTCPWVSPKETPLDFRLAAGTYFLQVHAVDQLGNSSNQQIGWTTKNQYKDMQQKLSIADSSKVDILFVIDNSGSMEFEQKSMAQRISTFSAQITNLDWQIGVTTTDPRDISLGDGRLVPMKGLSNQYLLNSKMDPAQVQKVLGQTLQRDEVGSGSEQGIYTTYRAVERAFTGSSSSNKALFRSDAALATIVISDEDESAQGPKNSPENLLSYIKAVWNGQKNFVFHSIVVRPGDKKCLDEQQTVYGERYAKLSALTGQGTVGGAILGSVCEKDYGTQLSGIGKSIQQMNQTLTLDCEPVENKVTILRNGVQVTESFERTGLKLVFKDSLLPGSYELSYKCLN